MKARSLPLLIATLLMAGCAPFSMEAQSRGDGTVYKGTAKKTGPGEGAMSITLNGTETYTGKVEKASHDNYAAFMKAYGHHDGTQAGYPADAPANGEEGASFMAYLRSNQGHWLRCAFFSNGRAPEDSGICVDSERKVYDVTIRATIEKSRSKLLSLLE
jgi:hypothetical protein